MLALLAGNHHRLFAVFLELINATGQGRKRYVHRIYDMALIELFLVPHVEYNGVFPVDHVHQLLSAHRGPTSASFIADKYRKQQDKRAYEKRMIPNKFNDLIHIKTW